MKLTLYSPKQIAEHNTHKSCWVIYRDKVYDLTSFVTDHPGGTELILARAGEDVTTVMSDPLEHEHSDAAYSILEEFCIGQLAVAHDSGAKTENEKQNDVKFLDLNQPLFPQMCRARFTKEFYMQQVHIPRHLSQPARIFRNPYLELLTMTPWWVIPIIWTPVVAYFYSSAVELAGVGAIFIWVAGLALWTVIEYFMHRFLFHVDELLPDNQLAFILHFFLHGIHHYIPMDRLRLVMPPVLFLMLATPFIKFFYATLPPAFAAGISSGAITGYICYDLTHYYLHHSTPKFKHFRDMKKYHIDHHYKQSDLGFGVTLKFWDLVFGTELK
ncbi:uncharacterized protein VTP21DRAFT_6400 [Calcarisporiella thermophila]|uniref:uncharacterized protein n=1 Tax=Calcarisporiella thermophila TaxID=911321 RepID=UPI003743C532